ncbi:MAG: response regulator [Bacteroidota bacterium]
MGDSSNPESILSAKIPLNILIAEDDDINQMMIRGAFAKLGYAPDMVANGRAAVEKVGEAQYDMVFMDLYMPEMDGWEAVAAIRAAGHEMPIVAMTAEVDEEKLAKCKAIGMVDAIQKPITMASITEAIENYGKA